MKRRWFRVATAVLAMTLAAAACSSADDDDDDVSSEETTADDDTDTTDAGDDDAPVEGEEGSTEAAQAAVDEILDRPEAVEGETIRGISDTEITIKGVTALTTPAGIEPFPGMCEGAQARFERYNREKAADARAINYLGCEDDTSDRDRNRQLMQEAVEEDEAFAIVPVTSQGFFSEDYLNEEHVPYIGFGFQPGFCGYEYPFAFGMSGAASCDALDDNYLVSQTLGGVYIDGAGVDPADMKVAIIAEDNPAGETGVVVVAQGVEAAGGEVVYSDNPLPPASATPVTDYTPFATNILDGDPNLVMLVTSDAPIIGLTTALRANGYTGDIMNFVYSDGRIFLQPGNNETLSGVYTVSQGVGAAVNGGDAFTQIADDLQAAGVEQYGQFPLATDPTTLTSGVLYGYGSADLFLAALAETPEPLTAEAFANTINSGFSYPGLGEALCPTLWPLQHLIGTPCASMIKVISDGQNPITNSAVGFFEPATELTVYPLNLVEK